MEGVILGLPDIPCIDSVDRSSREVHNLTTNAVLELFAYT